jgi:hypothetical protein
LDDSALIVACLCAGWCTSCGAFRAVFDAAAAAHPGATFRWIDIEEEAALVDDLDVENFPTLLIAASQPHFFGTVLPQPEVLARMIAAHRDPVAAAFDEEVVQLVMRLRQR